MIGIDTPSGVSYDSIEGANHHDGDNGDTGTTKRPLYSDFEDFFDPEVGSKVVEDVTSKVIAVNVPSGQALHKVKPGTYSTFQCKYSSNEIQIKASMITSIPQILKPQNLTV